jgi:hypothetical protein
MYEYTIVAELGIMTEGSFDEIFASSFFHESYSPKHLKITLGSFRIFTKIRVYICKARCATGINDTSGKFAIGVNDTDGKFVL